jgi:hypothetical protein
MPPAVKNRLIVGGICSPLLELASVLVRFDHVTRLIVNANHGIVGGDVENRSQPQQLQPFTVTETGTYGRP